MAPADRRLGGLLSGLLLVCASAVSAQAPAAPSAARFGAYAEVMGKTMGSSAVHAVVGPIETPLSIDLSAFLLDHPDMAAWLVRRHKIAPYVIEMRGPDESYADDGDGTTGFIKQVEKTQGGRAYYTEGTHKSAVFPDIHASAVILMDIQPALKPGCRPRVRSSFDVYVKMRSAFLSTMIKALRPFVKGLIIRKFTKAFSVADAVGRLLAKDPQGITQEILSYPKFSPQDLEAAKTLLSPLQPEPAGCL